jgi:hypothetical protein
MITPVGFAEVWRLPFMREIERPSPTASCCLAHLNCFGFEGRGFEARGGSLRERPRAGPGRIPASPVPRS